MIKKKDLLILIQMRKNSRSQLTEISKNTGIPVSTIYDRLKNNADNTIIKNICLIDYDAIGFNTRAQVCIKCGKDDKKEVYEFLTAHPAVNSLYKINNGYDFMMEVIFRNVKQLEEFLDGIEERFLLKTKQVYYVIEELKREGFFGSEEYLEYLSPTTRNG